MNENLRQELLLRYHQSFEEGDLGAAEEVLQAAEADPVLAQLIREADEPYVAEYYHSHPSAEKVDAAAIVAEAMSRYELETKQTLTAGTPPRITVVPKDPKPVPSEAADRSPNETPTNLLETFMEYIQAAGVTWEALALELGCSAAALDRIAASAPPRENRFVQDVAVIAGSDVDSRRLLMLLRRIRVLADLKASRRDDWEEERLLLAARSREPLESDLHEPASVASESPSSDSEGS